MSKFFIYFILLVSIFYTGCIEPFSFDVENVEAPLVIESYISNVSYNESVKFPSDGRFFTTTLRFGQNLSGKGQNAEGAQVRLISENGEIWYYTEIHSTPGTYVLLDPDFKAIAGMNYKLHITLKNDDQYESEWESFEENNNRMGNVSFVETERYETQFRPGDASPVIRSVRGINLTVNLPEFNSEEKSYYKWEYESTWIFVAGRLSRENPFYRCWVLGNSYLSQYNIAEVNSGGFDQELVFINVESNERVAENLSVLVKQFRISKEYYNFLNELNEQSQAGNIFAAPPYNLKTNYKSINKQKPVFGFFSVVHEEARRIYFSEDDLSYPISNSTEEMCKSAIPPYQPGDPCDNCLNYSLGGVATLSKPFWWTY